MGDSRTGDRHLGGTHRLEVHAAQDLGRGPRKRRIKLDLVARLVRRLAFPGRQGVDDPPARRPVPLPVPPGAEPRQHELHHAFQQVRIAPEDVKHLPEDLALVGTADQGCVQGPVKGLPVIDAAPPHRSHRAQGPTGPDRHAGGPQRPAEMQHVEPEPAAVLLRKRGSTHARRGARAIAASVRISVRMRFASLPWIRAMSSWYLSSTPSVLSTARASSDM